MSANAKRAQQGLAHLLLERYPDEAARVFETSADVDTVALLEGEPLGVVLEVLRRLTPDRAARVIAFMDAGLARRVLESLDANRAAALLARLDPEERESRLGLVDPTLAAELRALASYPPDTAAGLMDPRVTTFRTDATVRDVVRRLRRFRNKRIHDVFLVDEEGRLAGAVSLQGVVLAGPAESLGTLARPCPSVQATASREEVIGELERHRLATLPVVDFDGRLIGAIRQDRVITAAQEEIAADAVTMVGAGRDERALSPPLFAVRKRLPWLNVNLVTAFLAAAVVGLFEDTIAQATALAVLLPVVAGQSGNTGAQALAVTMRGLALREVRTRHWLRVAVKELSVGLGNGVAIAVVTGFAVYLWSGSSGLALVISVSMVLSMTIAGFSGATIPMLLTALRQDPAQSSSIILTTVTDVVGFFSFLGIATLLASTL